MKQVYRREHIGIGLNSTPIRALLQGKHFFSTRMLFSAGTFYYFLMYFSEYFLSLNFVAATKLFFRQVIFYKTNITNESSMRYFFSLRGLFAGNVDFAQAIQTEVNP